MLISFNIPISTKTVTISLFKIKQRLFDLFYCECFFFSILYIIRFLEIIILYFFIDKLFSLQEHKLLWRFLNAIILYIIM